MHQLKKITALLLGLTMTQLGFSAPYSAELVKDAESGHAQAQYDVGNAIYFGQGVTKNKSAGFAWLLKSAQQGYAPAQFSVAESYYWGIGTAKDRKTAFNWYQKSSDQKYAAATYHLGMAYLNGSGVAQNIEKGQLLRIQAGEMGHIAAQIDLAQEYRMGGEEYGIEVDEQQAAYWYRKAAVLGDRNATYNLGMMYENGEVGTDEAGGADMVQAIKLYNIAAEKGESTAQFVLCRHYLVGTPPLSQNLVKARELCLAAAKDDDYYAKLFLGRFYAQGIGGPKDPKQAYYWYQQVSEEQEARNFLQTYRGR
ncbi:TPR repeat protein [Acinetobacter calcoaceticus]|uniref:TPR repeat protein n=1 Tax=Acinetobacter calcoaceticus TaxID=471 RepID=A0A4R1XRK9_ACICA|nr:TPR repeat protein [Acinetobacter calcoaceticus]